MDEPSSDDQIRVIENEMVELNRARTRNAEIKTQCIKKQSKFFTRRTSCVLQSTQAAAILGDTEVELQRLVDGAQQATSELRQGFLGFDGS